MKLLQSVAVLFFTFCQFSSYAIDKVIMVTTANTCIGNIKADVSYVVNLDGISGAGVAVTTYFGDGQQQTNTSFVSNSFSGNHTYELQGVYNMKFVVTKNSSIVSTYSYKINASCTYVNVIPYFDGNQNCTEDANERVLSSPVLVDVYKEGVLEDKLFVTRPHLYNAEPNKSYEFRYNPSKSNSLKACGSTGSQSVTINSTNTTATLPYGLYCTNALNKDLAVNLTVTRYRPVEVSRLNITCKNLSCINNSGTLTFRMDPRYKIIRTNIPPATNNNNTLTWNVADLNIAKSKTIYVELEPVFAGAVSLTDNIWAQAILGPLTDDVNPNNNIVNDTTDVIGAFDPNEIQVSPGGYTTAGKQLDYTIHFENLGSDTAFNITVLDTLSQHFDLSTFTLTDFSHNINAEIIDGANGEAIARFQFDDIHLPDSNSKLYNKGYLKYSIKLKDNLSPSTTIENRAGIYFDINPVVMTNTVQNIIAPLNVANAVHEEKLSIYPNPANDVLYIQTNNKDYQQAKVLNNLGQVMSLHNIDKTIKEVNIAQLAPGIYHLLLQGDAGSKAITFQKN